METAKPLLTDPDIQPTPDVLQEVLGDTYTAFAELSTKLTTELNITMDWRYYNDSKAWLCKVAHKKKTVFWLSVWDGFFKTGFFFLERHLEGLSNLNIDDNAYILEKNVGKFIPLVFNISNTEQLDDLVKVAEFKKGTK